MRLIGLLGWYDEPRRDLERCITTFNQAGVTHLIAVDGAYGLFPGGQPCSPEGQVEHILQVCADLSMPVHVHQPSTVWATETDKRAHMFRLAEQDFRTDDRDWYCVMDADEYVLGNVNLPAILDRVTRDSADVMFHEPGGAGNPTKRFEIRCLFRALQGLTVKHNHHTYTVGDRVLWGFGQESGQDLTFITVVHTTNLRGAARRQVKAEYYSERDQAGIETHANCVICDAPSTVELRTSFDYQPAGDRLRSNAVLTCERHAQRIRYRNRNQLSELTAGILDAAPLVFDPNEVVTRLVVHLDAHEKIAASFGMDRGELIKAVENELQALLSVSARRARAS